MKEQVTCMLIDDDEDEHFIFGMALSQTLLPITCSYFLSWGMAQKALDNKAVQGPDFIFVDWYINGNDSAEYVKAISQTSRLKATRVVIYSGFEQLGIITKLYRHYDCIFMKKTESILHLTQELNGLFAS
jgi:DNA-binding NtrC family response regulator